MLERLFHQDGQSRRSSAVKLGAMLTLLVFSLALAIAKTPESHSHKGGNGLLLNLFARPKAALAGSTFQFTAMNVSVNEGDGKVVLMVNRGEDTSGVASVDYATDAGAPVASCGASNGIASEACDYTLTLGTLQFAANETSKTITVFLNDDAYAEGAETFTLTLSNPSNGATLATPSTATVTITDNDASNGQSAVRDGVSFNNSFFVRQQYIDFLNREPDASGLAFWKNQLDQCETLPLPSGFTDAQTCREVRRNNVSAAFFVSIEFQNTAYLVYRINQAAFNTGPTLQLRRFLKDAQEVQRGIIVGQSNWQQQIDSNKTILFNEFVTRPEFIAAFPANITAAAFVDALNANTKDSSNQTNGSLAQAERDNLVAMLSPNPSSPTLRAQTLRAVAENSVFQQREFARAFVLMQYFGYLRRNPNALPDSDFAGYDFWLNKLNSFGGNFINSEMVKAFINSSEYINRFGSEGLVGSTLTPEQRLAALHDVSARFASLSVNPDRMAVNQALLDFIRSRPEFAAAGISDDFCVWARYTDGIELIVVNNLSPPTGPPPVSMSKTPPPVAAGLQPANLPDSSKARMLFALGPTYYNPLPDVSTWLGEQNYFQSAGSFGASVEELKRVIGDGIFFFTGHGGTGEPRPDPPYCIASTTLPTPDLDRAYADDLKPTQINGQGRVRLDYMVTPYELTSSGDVMTHENYGITSEFIRKYWGNFTPNSFVFINACGSASPASLGFRDAIKSKGASVYAGWTTSVSNGLMFNTARFVFDRLLGANKILPEADGFRQRPFDYQSVSQDMKLHLLGTDPATGAFLLFFPDTPSADGFQTLAPSIWQMQSHEYENQLEIIGNFGQNPGSRGAVMIDGILCPISSWTEGPLGSIVCDLPKSGNGSAGDVIVTVDQHKSNAATLTEWEGDFTDTVTPFRPGPSTLKETNTYHVRFRADLRNARLSIHQAPTMLPRSFSATEDSLFSYENGGSFTSFDNKGQPLCTETWSGSGSFKRGSQIADRLFRLVGIYNNDKTLKVQLSVDSLGLLRTTECSDGNHESDNLRLYSAGMEGNTFNLVLDGSFNIVGNTVTFTDINLDVHTLKWGAMPAKFPPKADSPR